MVQSYIILNLYLILSLIYTLYIKKNRLTGFQKKFLDLINIICKRIEFISTGVLHLTYYII